MSNTCNTPKLVVANCELRVFDIVDGNLEQKYAIPLKGETLIFENNNKGTVRFVLVEKMIDAEVYYWDGRPVVDGSDVDLGISTFSAFVAYVRDAQVNCDCCQGGGSGVSTFIGLSDTASSYLTNAGFVPIVNAGETGLDFVDPSTLFTGTNIFNSNDSLTADRTVDMSDNFLRFESGGNLQWLLEPDAFGVGIPKITFPGIFDPIGIIWTESNDSSIPVAVGQGAIYISDGSDGVTANHPVYKDSSGTLHDLLTFSFVDLSDTPSGLTAGAGFVPVINAGGTALEFVDPATLGLGVSDLGNGLGIVNNAGNIEVSFDFTELANVATVDSATDRLIIYDASGTTHGFITPSQLAGASDLLSLSDTPGTFAGAGGYFAKVNAGATALEFVDPATLVNDQRNGLDISVNGSGEIEVAFDLTELGAIPAVDTTADRILVLDTSTGLHHFLTIDDIVAINDLGNGLDLALNSGNIEVSYDFLELANLATVDMADDRLIIYDASTGDHNFITPDQLTHSWIDLTDTPATLAGTGGYLVRTNAAETAIEHVDPTTLVNDQSNGLDITVNGSGQTEIALDFTELGNVASPDGAVDRIALYDVSGLTHGFITPSQIASLVDFISLADTPASYVGNEGFYPRVNSLGTALEFVDPDNIIEDLNNGLDISIGATLGIRVGYDFTELVNIAAIDTATDRFIMYDDSGLTHGYVTAAQILAAGVTSFSGLSDTPANLTGASLQAVRVNAGETALEFFDIDHDALTNFVANEHIDHSSVTLTAGTGSVAVTAVT